MRKKIFCWDPSDAVMQYDFYTRPNIGRYNTIKIWDLTRMCRR